jgi:hypothetical protein
MVVGDAAAHRCAERDGSSEASEDDGGNGISWHGR